MSQTIPTHKEELTLKVLEVYEQLLAQHEKDLITNAQLNIAVNTLVTATGWGIERQAFLLLSEFKIDRDTSFTDRRYFVYDDQLIRVSLDAAEWMVAVASFKQGQAHGSKIYSFDREMNPVEASAAFFQKTVKRLQAKGARLI